MLLQEHMIERVRALCQADPHVEAAMMYGSFAYGEGDEYSDIEVLLFFDNDFFPALNRQQWLEQIAPVEMLFVNEFGISVAIFANLIRGEFHFHTVSEVGIAQAWPGQISFPCLDATLLVDKSNHLTPFLLPLIGAPPAHNSLEQVQFVVNCFINHFLFGHNVLRRGESARALEMLSVVQRELLWIARILEAQAHHWHIPARLLEHELSPEAYARFQACTSALEPSALGQAYRAAWMWGRDMLAQLQTEYQLTVPQAVCAQIDSRINH
jgi:lincosamide nucleotidyltransferase